MFSFRYSVLLCAIGLVFSCGCLDQADAQRRSRKIRNFKDVKAITIAHFSDIKGFEEGDLITQDMTIRLFQRLERFGWRVSDAREIVESTLASGDFLVKTFKTAKGRSFLKTISRQKEGIDRADRMSRMPNGKKNISDLVHKIPNGADLIVSLASKKNGRQVSQRMAGTRHGKDFNKPTGRLYPVDHLIDRLQVSFEKMQTRTIHNRY